MRHPLFIFYRGLYVFCFQIFSNISGTASGSEYIWFCRESQALSFDKKRFFNHGKNRGEIHKILTAQFFMGHPLRPPLKKVNFRQNVRNWVKPPPPLKNRFQPRNIQMRWDFQDMLAVDKEDYHKIFSPNL